MNDNPLMLVHKGLWTLVERNTTLMNLVRPNNRIKYLDTLGPKKEISPGDLPELALISSGGELTVRSSSSAAFVTHKYSWGVATGEYDINRVYNQVLWELYRGLVDWDSVLCSLTWPSNDPKTFVQNMETISLDEGTMLVDENRGLVGWSGIMQISVMMSFCLDDLRIV